MPSFCSPNYFSIVCLILFFGTRSLYLPLFILVPIRSFRTSKTFDIQLWRENPYSLRFKLRLHSHSEVLVAIGNALRFIHQEGVLHRDVWSSKGYQRLHLHTEVACIFFVEATSNTHWPQRTHQNTYTKKHKKQKTKQKTHGHTHTQWIPTKKPMQRHTAKLFAIPGETWEPPPLSKRTPRSQPYGGGLGETVESLDFFWSLEMIAVWRFFFSEVISWKDSFDDQQKQEVLVLGGNPYDKHQGSILRKFFAYCSSISATDFSTVQSIAQEQDLDIPNWYFSWRNRVLSLL